MSNTTDLYFEKVLMAHPGTRVATALEQTLELCIKHQQSYKLIFNDYVFWVNPKSDINVLIKEHTDYREKLLNGFVR